MEGISIYLSCFLLPAFTVARMMIDNAPECNEIVLEWTQGPAVVSRDSTRPPTTHAKTLNVIYIGDIQNHDVIDINVKPKPKRNA
jgi:hypothetical protein